MRRSAACLLACALVLTLWGSASAAFSDVREGDWFYEAVTEMEGAGWIRGYPDGTFGPQKPISAAEFVAITVRMAGIPVSEAGSGYWAASYLESALQKGYYDWDEIPPTGETFEEPIRRELAVKILMRALFPEARGDYTVESAKIRDFSELNGRYYEPVLAAYAQGIVLGDDTGSFRPGDSLSRAEAAMIFCRASRKQGNVAPSEPISVSEGQRPTEPTTGEEAVSVPVSGGVRENGWLRVEGTQLVNERGEPVVLRGMSSHGLQWYGQFTSREAIANTARWGANLFRAAMYTGEGGYFSDPEGMEQKLTAAVDAAVSLDLYVIIDWHILSDGDPSAHTEEAAAFFTRMAKRYADEPAVLFEICNEPNGGVTWSGNVKPYAERVISAIRDKAPEQIILVGTPTWSQDLQEAAKDPLEGHNLMYTLHFYAGTHGEELRRRIDDARKAGLAVFVSEWGVSRADGSGGVFTEAAETWLNYLEKRGISWANWSLCDKNETSAALLPGTDPGKEWTEKDLSASGRFVFARFRGENPDS